jgi:hypothetical protein
MSRLAPARHQDTSDPLGHTGPRSSPVSTLITEDVHEAPDWSQAVLG